MDFHGFLETAIMAKLDIGVSAATMREDNNVVLVIFSEGGKQFRCGVAVGLNI